MTLTTTHSREQYVGDGKQQLWPVPFAFVQPEHVLAIHSKTDGTHVTLAYGYDYTVTGGGTGGTLQYLLPAGDRLTIWREMPLTQELDLHNTGPLDMEAVERALDGITMQVQQLNEGMERCVKMERTAAGLTPDQMLDTLSQRIAEVHQSAGIASGSALQAEGAAERAAASVTAAGAAKDGAVTAQVRAEGSLITMQQTLAVAKNEILAQAGPVPIGMEATFPVNTIPSGWLVEDGRTITKVAYPELVKYLTGSDTAQTATLPDMRGEFARGADLGRGVDTGRTVGSWQADEFKSHSHSVPYIGDRSGTRSNTAGDGGGVYILYTPPSGSTGGVETRPRNIAKVWCIKAYNTPGVAQLANITTIMNRLDTQAAAVNPNVGKFCRIGLVAPAGQESAPVGASVDAEMTGASQARSGEDWKRDTTTLAMTVPEAGIYQMVCSAMSTSSVLGDVLIKVNGRVVSLARMGAGQSGLARATGQLAAGDVMTCTYMAAGGAGGYYRDPARTWAELRRVR